MGVVGYTSCTAVQQYTVHPGTANKRHVVSTHGSVHGLRWVGVGLGQTFLSYRGLGWVRITNFNF